MQRDIVQYQVALLRVEEAHDNLERVRLYFEECAQGVPREQEEEFQQFVRWRNMTHDALSKTWHVKRVLEEIPAH